MRCCTDFVHSALGVTHDEEEVEPCSNFESLKYKHGTIAPKWLFKEEVPPCDRRLTHSAVQFSFCKLRFLLACFLKLVVDTTLGFD